MTDCVWYYIDNGQQKGPVTEATVADMVRSGQMGPQSMVWCPGCPNWMAVSQHPALQQLLVTAQASAPQNSTPPVPAMIAQSASVQQGQTGDNGFNGRNEQSQLGADMVAMGANGFSGSAVSSMPQYSAPAGNDSDSAGNESPVEVSGSGQSTVNDLNRLLTDVQSKAASRAEVEGQEIPYFTVYNQRRRIYRVYGMDQYLLFLPIGYLPPKADGKTNRQPELLEGKTAEQLQKELNETMMRVGRVNRKKLEKLMSELEGSFAIQAENLTGVSIAGASGGDLSRTMPHDSVLVLKDSQIGTVTCYLPAAGDVMEAVSTLSSLRPDFEAQLSRAASKVGPSSARNTVSSRPAPSGKIPTWAIVVAVVAVIGFVFMTTAVAIGSWVINMGKEANDPERAGKVLARVLTVKEPLPSGWKHKYGFDYGAMKMAAVDNKRSLATIQFARYRGALNRGDSILQGQIKGAQLNVESQGEETIGGQTIKYYRGHAMIGLTSLAMELAKIETKDGDVVTIQAMEVSKDAFDPSLVQPIYDSIESFN